MLLRDRISAMIYERRLGLFSAKRVESALRTLETELGALDVAELTGELQLAQKVSVPGDVATYIVVGEWDDGTLDIIREQGSFQSEFLIGWRPGQSLRDYQRELAEEKDLAPEEQEDEPARKPVRPLFDHGRHPR